MSEFKPFTLKDARGIRVGDIIFYVEEHPSTSRPPRRDQLSVAIVIERHWNPERRISFGVLTRNGECRTMNGFRSVYYNRIYAVSSNVLEALPEGFALPLYARTSDGKARFYAERRRRLRALLSPDKWTYTGDASSVLDELSAALNPALPHKMRLKCFHRIGPLYETPREYVYMRRGLFRFDLINLFLLLDDATLDEFLDKE